MFHVSETVLTMQIHVKLIAMSHISSFVKVANLLTSAVSHSYKIVHINTNCDNA